MARRAKRQLKGRHLLLGEYLRSWTTLNVHYRRWTIIWRIMEISEGVIRLGLRSSTVKTLLDAVIRESFPFMMHTTFSEDREKTAPFWKTKLFLMQAWENSRHYATPPLFPWRPMGCIAKCRLFFYQASLMLAVRFISCLWCGCSPIHYQQL